MIPPALVVFLARLTWVLFHRRRGIFIARVLGFAFGLVVGVALVGLAR